MWRIVAGVLSDTPTGLYMTSGSLIKMAPIARERSFVRSFFAGSSLAYSGLQRVGRQQAQCACPRERGGELVGVCSVWATCRKDGLSRRE